MKRKKRKIAPKRACGCGKRQSLVIGLCNDLWLVVQMTMRVGSWPCRATATLVHSQLRKHPSFRFKHAHAVLCMSMGFALLGITFMVENAFHHAAWSMTVETMRAAGVCPIWETIAAMMKIGSEFEA
jgi:hypothetical protein